MKTNSILTKVYSASAMVIVSVLLLACLIYKWPLLMVAIAMLASIVLSAPALVSLQLVLWLSQKIKLERGFVWMVLMAFIPLLALLLAWLFADYVPGKTGFLMLLGMASGYVAVLSYGISIAQFFNPNGYEKE
jgi:FtsH-binding integral membrane protein